jgi:hypothetical protein
MGGIATGGPELEAVTSGTWPIVGVGLLGRPDVWIEVIVAIEDCEFDLVGLPGRIINGAGDGCDGINGTGDALVSEGDSLVVGVGAGVEPEDVVGSGIDVNTTG